MELLRDKACDGVSLRMFTEMLTAILPSSKARWLRETSDGQTRRRTDAACTSPLLARALSQFTVKPRAIRHRRRTAATGGGIQTHFL